MGSQNWGLNDLKQFEGTNSLLNIDEYQLMDVNDELWTVNTAQLNDKWQFCVLNDKTWLPFHRITAILIRSALQ